MFGEDSKRKQKIQASLGAQAMQPELTNDHAEFNSQLEP